MERAFADADDCAANEPLASSNSDPVNGQPSPTPRVEAPMISAPLEPHENDDAMDESGGGGGGGGDDEDSALQLLTPPPPGVVTRPGKLSRQGSPDNATAARSVAVEGVENNEADEDLLDNREGGGEGEGGRRSRGEMVEDGEGEGEGVDGVVDAETKAEEADEADVTLADLRLAASPNDDDDVAGGGVSPSPWRRASSGSGSRGWSGSGGGRRSPTIKGLDERLASAGVGSGLGSGLKSRAARLSMTAVPVTPRGLDARAQAKVSSGYRGLVQIGVRTAVERETRFLGSQM